MNRKRRHSLVARAAVIVAVLATMQAAFGEKRGFMLQVPSPANTASDIEFAAEAGATIVRLPLYIGGAHSSMAYWFDFIDAALEVTQPLGMTLVVDMHWPTPGMPESSFIADPDDFANRWAAVAQRYKDRPAFALWFDLCNEPSSQQDNWRQVAKQAALAIRAHDGAHKIVFSPRGSAIQGVSLFEARPLPGISKQIIGFHLWDWIGDVQAPTGAITPYPSPGRKKANLAAKLDFLVQVREEYDVPVYLGEVGIRQDHPNAPRFLRDVTTMCAARDIHCTVHALREYVAWNYELNPDAWAELLEWLDG